MKPLMSAIPFFERLSERTGAACFRRNIIMFIRSRPPAIHGVAMTQTFDYSSRPNRGRAFRQNLKK
jgi:hypothetical protein